VSGARSWRGNSTTAASTHTTSFLNEGRSVPVMSVRTGEKEDGLRSRVHTHAHMCVRVHISATALIPRPLASSSGGYRRQSPSLESHSCFATYIVRSLGYPNRAIKLSLPWVRAPHAAFGKSAIIRGATLWYFLELQLGPTSDHEVAQAIKGYIRTCVVPMRCHSLQD
jgi:hypothetical protein